MATANQQQEQQTQAIDAVSEPMTAGETTAPRDIEAELASAVRTRDMAKMDALGKEIFQITDEKPTKDAPAANQPEASGPVHAAAPHAATETPKTFKVKYRGREIELPDDNNLLGLPSTGHLKREYVIAKQRLQDIENDLNLTREEARKLQLKAQEELQALRAELERRNQLSNIAPNAPQPTATNQEQSTGTLSLPKRPERPVLSTSDPAYYTEEDLKRIAEYEKARDKYDDDMIAYLTQLQTRPAQIQTVLPEEIQKRLQRADEVVRKLTEAEHERIARENADRYWKSIESFQQAHKEFATPKNIRELDREIQSWMDRLAEHHGIRPPLTPKYVVDSSGNTVLSSDWYPYENNKTELVRRYINDDKDILDKSEGVAPPEGYKEYFRLAELESDLRDMKARKRLGESATLEDAFLLSSKDSGILDETTDALAAAERAKAAEAIGNAVQQRLQSAVSMEPAKGGTPVPAGVSLEDINWFTGVPADSLARDPALKRRFDEIVKQLRQANML